MENTLPVAVKATRITEMVQPTPQQLIEAELTSARNAMDTFYTEIHTTVEPTSEALHDEEADTKNQNSVEPNKRANPKVGRASGPKRKGSA